MTDLSEVLDGIKPSRGNRQNVIEELLRRFEADAMEAQDILGALFAHFRDDEVCHYLDMLRNALGRLEKQQAIDAGPDECDAYHKRRAFDEGD